MYIGYPSFHCTITHTYRISVVVGYIARYFHGLWWRVGIAYPVRLLGDSVGSRARSLGGGWGEPLSLKDGRLVIEHANGTYSWCYQCLMED